MCGGSGSGHTSFPGSSRSDERFYGGFFDNRYRYFYASLSAGGNGFYRCSAGYDKYLSVSGQGPGRLSALCQQTGSDFRPSDLPASKILGYNGVLASQAISDGITAILAAALLIQWIQKEKGKVF